jgi:hypothetical protein
MTDTAPTRAKRIDAGSASHGRTPVVRVVAAAFDRERAFPSRECRDRSHGDLEATSLQVTRRQVADADDEQERNGDECREIDDPARDAA